MQIGLKLSPRQIQTLKPTLQQLQYYRLLQQTNLQLEEDIREELSQNPALEVEETRRCPKCGEIILDHHRRHLRSETQLDHEWSRGVLEDG